MDFKLTSEQQMLQDSVRRYVEGIHGFKSRAARIASDEAKARNGWSAIANNGWLSAIMPAAHGGLDGTIVEAALIAHEVGRGLVLQPFVGCGVLPIWTLMACASAEQLDAWLPAMAEGDLKFAVAFNEPQARGIPSAIMLRAERTVDAYRLSGRKTQVLGGGDADKFIVSAQTGSGHADQTLFVVDAQQAGIRRSILPLHDGSHVAELTFDDVLAPSAMVLGRPGEGLAAIQWGLLHATAALCSEMIGAMERAIEITADYLRVRKQFGVTIAQFQVLQHRMADMASELELARSMLHALLAAIQGGSGSQQQWALSQAKAFIGRATKAVCGQAIQLHGGVGMTEEYVVGHYFKRAVVLDLLLGSGDRHDEMRANSLNAGSGFTIDINLH